MKRYEYENFWCAYSEDLNKDIKDIHGTSVGVIVSRLIDRYVDGNETELLMGISCIEADTLRFYAKLTVSENKEVNFRIRKEVLRQDV